MRNLVCLAILAIVGFCASEASAQCGSNRVSSSQQLSQVAVPVQQLPISATQTLNTAQVAPQPLQLQQRSSGCASCNQSLQTNALARFTLPAPQYTATQTFGLAQSTPCQNGNCPNTNGPNDNGEELKATLKSDLAAQQPVYSAPVYQTASLKSEGRGFHPFEGLRDRISPPAGLSQKTTTNRRGDVTQVQKYRAPRN